MRQCNAYELTSPPGIWRLYKFIYFIANLRLVWFRCTIQLESSHNILNLLLITDKVSWEILILAFTSENISMQIFAQIHLAWTCSLRQMYIHIHVYLYLKSASGFFWIYFKIEWNIFTWLHPDYRYYGLVQGKYSLRSCWNLLFLSYCYHEKGVMICE